MLKLIQNEWMKLWSKKASWFMIIILIISIIGVGSILKFVAGQTDAPPTMSYEQQQSQLEMQLQDPNIDPGMKASIQDELDVVQQKIDSGKTEVTANSAEKFIVDGSSLMSIVTLLTVIVAAGIVAAEFSQGTIKMLLTRPVKRWKILLSKYITTLLYGALLSVVAMIVTIVLGYILFEPSGGVFFQVTDGTVEAQAVWPKIISLFALSYVSVAVYSTLAFMIGSVFRSSSLAIGLSIFFLFVGPNIVFFLSRYEIAKYLFFAHTDLAQYSLYGPMIEGMTMTFSVIVLLIYVAIFIAVSFWTFNVRDVKA